MKMKEMNILAAVDEKFLDPLSVTIYSLLMHNRKKRIKLYILHLEIPKESQEKFEIKLKKYSDKLEIIFIKVDKSKVDWISKTTRWGYETYLRLMAPDILPEDMERILWLDGDIVVNGNLDELYEQTENGEFAAVCEDCNSKCKKYNYAQKIGVKYNQSYFNAGVMLLFLNNIRKNIKTQEMFEWMRENPEKLFLVDQNVLNYFMGHNVKWMDSKIYNYMTMATDPLDSTVDILTHTKILHYSNGKPWNPNYEGKLELVFWFYAVRVWGVKRMLKHWLAKLNLKNLLK